MGRTKKRKGLRWDHPDYKKGVYCFERNGYIHTYIFGERFSINNLPWDKKNKDLAMQVLDKRLQEYYQRQNGLNAERIDTFSELFVFYKELRLQNIKGTSKRTAINFVKLIIQDNDFRLNDTIGISKYISKRVNELLNKEGYSKSTLNMAISRLRSVFHFAIEANIMTNNPVKSWMKNKDVKHKFRICSRQQLNEFFRRMEEFIADKKNAHRIKTAYRVYYAIKLVSITGMRRGEVQKLRTEHIMKNKLIIDGKGDIQREFPYSINPALKPLLDDILAYGNRSSRSTPYLLGRSSPSAMGVLLESFKKAVGLSDDDNLKYHAIRKLVENEMMNDDKLNDNLVRSLIGHTIVTQSQHYLNRLTAEEIEEIIEKNKTK